MIPECLTTRLTKDIPTLSITLRAPSDVVESMEEIAPQRGFAEYQALKKRSLPDDVLAEGAKKLAAA